MFTIKKVLHLISTERMVLYFALVGWFKDQTVQRNTSIYPYNKTSQIKTIVILFSILILLEGTIFHFLIQLWSQVAAWALTILNIYALLYMVGLYHSVRTLPHTLNKDTLIIRHGYQSSIEINIKNIESIKPAKDQEGIEDKRKKDIFYALMVMDSPQYEILLKKPAPMIGMYGRKKYVKTIVFRADDPNQMVEDIKRTMGSSGHS
ncbi:hypothetical protein [Oceanobacillus manasiensis]|uniref:hypothetical protein n=1 Tax=Oceanobacillus manasiensis TaxID=586413 RepID=UPI0006936E27|nr:hypothetical protein [Oceanobacillus manasiensis]